MDEITIGDKVYVSSKRAAKITGYAKDYVGQLCREGRVEARLVGRNWYVLETSIREHRFGQPELAVAPKEEIPASPVSEWSAPRYEAVTAPTIPQFTPKAAQAEPVIELTPMSVATPDSEKVVEDMQEAWREWFNRQEKTLPDGTEDFIPEDMPLVVEDEAIEDDLIEEPVEPEPVAEEEPEGEVIAIHRSYPAPVEPEYSVRRAAVVDLTPRRPVVEEDVEEEPAPQKRNLAARKEREGARGDGGMVLKAVFLSVAALAVIIAFIGSGYADSLLNIHGSNAAQQGLVNYLQGASTVNK